MRQKNDHRSCDITGMDVTADGNIILADSHNKKVKMLTCPGKLLSSLKVAITPIGVTSLSRTEVVVTMYQPFDSQLQIITMTDVKLMSVKRSINLRDFQLVLASTANGNNNLVISGIDSGDNSCVRMIDMDGNIIWTKVNDKNGYNLFSSQLYLTIQPGYKSDRVTVSDMERSHLVVLAANTGDVLKVCSTKERNLSYVASDRYGSIYVFDEITAKMIVLSADLEEERCFGLGSKYPIPRAIVCDKKRDELLLSNRIDGNHLYRFRILMK